MRRAGSRVGKVSVDRSEGSEGRSLLRLRKSKCRRLALESLEERTLLSTLPTTSATAWANLNTAIGESGTGGAGGGNNSSPTIVIDPNNSLDLAAVWVRTTGTGSNRLGAYSSTGAQYTSVIEGAYSTDGGNSWNALTIAGLNQVDLSQSQVGVRVGYNEITDPSIAFDGSHNLYLSYSEHNNSFSAGSIDLDKFTFNGGAPTQVTLTGGGSSGPYSILYQWAGTQGSAPAYAPALAVDSSPVPNASTFLQGPVGVNVGPAGNVYVSTPSGNMVMQYSLTTGGLLNTYASAGQASPQYQAFNNTNTELYVPNPANQSVTAYDTNPTTPPTSTVDGTFTLKGDTLNVPEGEAYGPDGNLYVVNTGGNDVLEYDGFSGAFIKDFVLPGTGGLNAPNGIAFVPGDVNGSFYVSSSNSNQILEFYGPKASTALQGTLVPGGTITGNAKSPLGQPGALAYAPAASLTGANDLFIANTGNESLTTNGGTLTAPVFQGASLSNPLGEVMTTTTLSNGDVIPVLLVVNQGSATQNTGSILEYDGTSGAFIKTLVSNLPQPDSIAVDSQLPTGNVYVTSSTQNEVLSFTVATGANNPLNPSGAVYASFGMSTPAGLTFDPKSGNLFVVSTATNSVEEFNGPTSGTPGAFVTQFVNNSGLLSKADGIAFGPDSNLYISSSQSNTIVAYQGTTGASPGAPIKVFVSAGLDGMINPKGIAFDPSSGNLLVAASGTVYEFYGPTGVAPGSGVTTPFGVGIYTNTNALSSAYGIAIGSNGLVYVSSTGTSEVLQFGGTSNAPVAAGNLIGDFAASYDPTGLAFDGSGNLYVSIGSPAVTKPAIQQKGMVIEYTLGLDASNNIVATYAGTVADPQTALFTKGAVSDPIGLTFDSSGKLYVVSAGDAEVMRFAPPAATTPPTFPWTASPSSGNGAAVYTTAGLSAPFDIAIGGTAGNVYVTDDGFAPGQVVQFAGPAAVNAGTLLSPAAGFAAVFDPVAVAFDSSGNLYVANQSANMIEKFDASTGAYKKTFVVPQFVSANGGLSVPTDIAFNALGDLFVSSSGSDRVIEYSPTGAFLSDYTSSKVIGDPEGLAFDASDNLYVADGFNNDVLRFAVAGGAATTFVGVGQGGLSAPRGLAFDSLGNLYVASSTNDVVMRYTSAGVNDPITGNPATTAVFAGGAVGYTDPTTGASQSDVLFGNIYVAWTTNDTYLDANGTNPNNIRVVGSDDGGQTISAPRFLNTDGNAIDEYVGGSNRDFTPSLVVSDLSNNKIGGGVLTAVWDNNPNNGNPDNIETNQITNGVDTHIANGPGVAIQNAIAPATTPPNFITRSTTSTISVAASDFGANFSTLSNINVTLNITSPNEGLNTMEAILIPPASTGVGQITLFTNATDVNGNATGTGGISGNYMGSTGSITNSNVGPASSTFIGATFDDGASHSITNTANPTGRFRPFGSMSALYSGNNLLPINLAGIWTLKIINFNSTGTNPQSQLDNWSITFTSGLTPGANQVSAGTSTLHGSLYQAGLAGSTYTGASSGAIPIGFGAQPVIAEDETLGSFSPYQGNIYIAYATHLGKTDPTINPANNTQIILATSTDGGASYTQAQVDRDPPDHAVGPLFQPTVAVDQATGTVVVGYYDTRYDAAQARVAYTIQTSIDGGTTFSANSFLNQPNQAYDEASGSIVTLGPIPDNDSGANPIAENTFSFGEHQGLAVFNGVVYGAWSSNLNGGTSHDNNYPGDLNQLDITVATATIASGPRIVDGTSGPVGPGTINNSTAVDGSPIAQRLYVRFDRPIDPNSFNLSEVTISALDANGNPLASIVPTNVTPIGTAFLTYTPPVGQSFSEYEEFEVDFTPDSTPGTVSYSISPASGSGFASEIHDLVRTLTSDGNVMDQNQNRVIDGNDAFAQPAPATPGSAPLAGAGTYANNSLPIIVPGPHLVGTNVGNSVGVGNSGPQGTSDNEILNSTGSYINVNYDREMNASSATQGVESISVTNGGTGYTSVPIVTIAGGQGAAATALLGVTTITAIANGGSGYSVGELLTLLGGVNTVPATIKVTAVDPVTSAVTAAIVLSEGTYTSLPGNPASVTSATGSGARFDVSGGVSAPFLGAATITSIGSGGSGYNVGDTLSVAGGTGSLSALIEVTSVSAGAVTSAVLLNPGIYTSAPASPVTTSDNSGSGSGATFNLSFDPLIKATSGGTNYTTAPLVFFGGNNTSMATGIAAILGGQVTGILVTNTGSGYTAAPTVYFSGGATATATVVNGKVTQINIVNGGMFYTSIPAVTITGGNPTTNATATAQLWPNPVLQIVGPAGQVNLPQTFSASAVNQNVPKTAGQALNSTIDIPPDKNTFALSNLTVTVNIADAAVADLTGYLIAPNGTRVLLFQNVGGPSGQNFTNTTFSDSATTAINDPASVAPFTGSFRPQDTLGLSQLLQGGLNATDLASDLAHSGWTLQLTDNNPNDGKVATLLSWSLTATPVINVLPLVPGANPGSYTGFMVTFPQQSLSGTYTVQLAPTIVSFVTGVGGLSINGSLTGPYENDQNLNAGVYNLTGNLPPATLTTTYSSIIQTPVATTPVSITPQTQTGASTGAVVVPDNSGAESPITFPLDHGTFPITSLTLTVNISASANANLTGYLVSPTGQMVELFTGLSGQNLVNTTFSDSASQPIGTGTASYTGTFKPVSPLSALNLTDLAFDTPHATWKLLVVDSHAGGPADSTTINSWSMTANDNLFTSQITINDNYTITAGTTLALDIQDTHDPDLTAFLVPPPGMGVAPIELFSGVGATGTQQNFIGTVFNDGINPVTGQIYTPIQKGGPPFTGSFSTQLEPSTNGLKTLTGKSVNGVWTLEIINNTQTGSGALKDWSLTFNKQNGGSGLGETVADQASASFRIFTMDPTNPQSSQTWTAVGPASLGGGQSGRVTAIAVDPSDPSDNTVYAAGAEGGVWKTTNFLTTNPGGPTWIPLTDFGPDSSINMGGLAVFPRNNDPRQSIIFAATGQADANWNQGVGILRSEDGGQTWQLLDSTVNVDSNGNYLPLSSPLRDHAFVGNTSFKIVVDPKPAPNGNAIVYAVFNGPNGGIWKSSDSGNTWGLVNANFNPKVPASPSNPYRIANLAGQGNDFSFDNSSGTVNVISNPTGNLQIMFAALQGQGVYLSTDEGQSWNLMTGGIGNPLIQDGDAKPPIKPPVPVSNPGVSPNFPSGRILLASPDLVANYTATDQFPFGVQNYVYSGWLYALVVNPDNSLHAVYMTKDFGQNWVNVPIPVLENGTPASATAAIPTLNAPTPTNPGAPNFDVFNNGIQGQGNYDATMAIDPLNPNILYVGGAKDLQVGSQGFIRIDTTNIADAHAFYTDSLRPDGGQILVNANSPVVLKAPNTNNSTVGLNNNPWQDAIMNLINPGTVFFDSSTYYIDNTQSFANDGTGVTWSFMSSALAGSTDQHKLLSMIDPLTGEVRLIFGDDQGIFTGIDNNGVFISGVDNGRLGTASEGFGARNGNLQITELYQGAVQPSAEAAAAALFYAGAQDNGADTSGSYQSVIGQGQISWGVSGGDASAMATDAGGSGSYYQYLWPCCGGNNTDFFLVNGNPSTNGLVLPASFQQDFPQVADVSTLAVNPIQGNSVLGSGTNAGKAQILIGSLDGRLFRTEDSGATWFVIADNTVLDGSNVTATAFGAPDSSVTGNSLDSFIYAGMGSGKVYVTIKGGGLGSGTNPWININNGALAGNNAPVQAIVASPDRGNHEAYLVTTNGVYFNQDTVGTYDPVTGLQITPPSQWVNVTGDLFNLPKLNGFNDPNQTYQQLGFLTSLAVDWRYVIPNNFASPPANPTDPTQTHPVLYVAGTAGVFRSTDDGQTWALFPSQDPNSASSGVTPITPGGDIPNVKVSNLQMAIGNVDPTSGRPVQTVDDPNLLVATTFGRGDFAIRLAPDTFPASLALDPVNPPPGGSDSGQSPTDKITNVWNSVIDGYSEQSAFGNTVRITLVDETDPLHPTYIGGYDGAKIGGQLITGEPAGAGFADSTGTNAAYQTNATGQFAVPISIRMPDGVRTIGVVATDSSGTQGNIALFTFTLITATPPTPSQPTLDPASDTGTLGDNITSINQPFIDVAVTENPQTVPFQIILMRSTSAGGPFTQVATIPIPQGAGTYPIQDLNTLVDTTAGTTNAGTNYYYEAEQEDVAGNFSGLSSIYQLTYKSTATRPTNLTLDPASDSGVKLDNITNNTSPTFDVSSIESSALQVVLLRSSDGGVTYNAVKTVNLTAPTTTPVQIQDPGPVRPDGRYLYEVEQIDVAGNLSAASLPLPIVIVATPPTPPSLVLNPVSDSGVKGDHITNVTTNLQFVVSGAIVTLPAPFQNDAPEQVLLLRSTTNLAGSFTPVASATATSTSIILADPGPLNNGTTYYYEVEQEDAAGNISTPSTSVPVTIKTTAQTPNGLALAPGSDSGASSTDNITNVTHPSFVVSNIEATAQQVILLREPVGGSTFSTVSTLNLSAPTTNPVTIQDPGPVQPDGAYLYEVEEVDVAGNTSSPSTPALQVLVVATPPSTPSVTLDPGSDSGVPGDNITNTTSPTFDISGATASLAAPFSGDAPDQVMLLRSTSPTSGFVTVATATATGSNLTLQDSGPLSGNPPVAGVTYYYEVEQEDIAGNFSTPSAPLAVTIKTTAPTPSGLALDPNHPSPGGSDTGRSNADAVTNDSAPFLVVSGIEANAQSVTLLSSSNASGPFTPVVTATPPTFNSNGTVSIQAPAQSDGVVYFEVQQVDVAGNTSTASAPLKVLVVTSTPATPSLALDALSDSGTVGDNITNVTDPLFDVSGLSVPFPADGPEQLFLLRSATGTPGSFTQVATITNSGTIRDPGPLAGAPPVAGITYYYEVQAEDVAGNFSADSAPLAITIKTTAQTPTGLALDPSHPSPGGSDTGLSSTDNITNDTTPFFTVSSIENGAEKVLLLRSTSATGTFTAVNTLNNPTIVNGTVSIQDTTGVTSDGIYYYEVEQVDIAGNLSSHRSPLSVLFVTAKPTSPSLTLDPASDTGTLGDNITSNINPAFDVSGVTVSPPFPADGPFQVILLRSTSASGPFNQVATVSGSGSGSVTVQDPTGDQPDGFYYYEIEQEDIAGNVSAPSSPLKVLIVTTPPASPSLTLSGGTVVGNTSVTNVTSPTFNVTGVTVTPPFPGDGTQKLILLRSSTNLSNSFSPVATLTNVAPGSDSIQDPGPVPSDGYYYYEVEQVDVAGNVSVPSAALKVLVVTATPSTPAIALSSDSGVLGDKITNVTNPSFNVSGVTVNPPFVGDAPYEVLLLRGTSASGPFNQVAMISGGSTGSVTIQDPGPLAGNPPIAGIAYYYEVEQQDVAGNISSPSAPYKITIKTTAQTPNAPALDPTSQSGASATTTSIVSPVFDVANIEPTAQQVILLRSTSQNGTYAAVNTLTNPTVTNGSVSIQDPGPVQPDGTYYYEIKQVDVAGNTSTASASLALTINTAAPPVPGAPTLDPTSQTGGSANPNMTKDNGSSQAPLTFQVSVTSTPAVTNPYVYLYDVTGTTPVLIGGPVQAVNGVATITVNNHTLADGVHDFATSVAANPTSPQSGLSASTAITIQTSTHYTGDSLTSNFFTSAPGSYVFHFDHELAGFTPDVANGTGIANAPFAVMIIPSGPDGRMTQQQTGTFWSAPNGADGGDLPIHSTVVYHVNGDGTSQLTLTPIVPMGTNLYLLSVQGSLTDLAGNTVTSLSGKLGPFYDSFDLRLPQVNPAAPQVVNVSTNNGATRIVPGTNPTIAQPDTIAIQFNKAMNFYDINNSTVFLQALPNGTSNLSTVPTVVTYSPSTQTAYLTPTARLTTGTKYIIVVRGALTDDTQFPSDGTPIGADYFATFEVATNPVVPGPGSFRVTATTPQNGTAIPSQFGYVSVTFSGPLSTQAVTRFDIMLTPNPSAPNNYVPVNAKIAFNPNTDQEIIVPTDVMGHAIDYLGLQNLYEANLDGSPNLNAPLLNVNGLPAGMNGNIPYYATWLLNIPSPSASRSSSSAAEFVTTANATPPTGPAAVIGSTIATIGHSTDSSLSAPGHVSANRVAQTLAEAKRSKVRFTKGDHSGHHNSSLWLTALDHLADEPVRRHRRV